MQMTSSANPEARDALITSILEAKGSLQILQLPQQASYTEAKAQYKRIALLLHPDKFPGHQAREAFQKATDALRSLQNVATCPVRHVLLLWSFKGSSQRLKHLPPRICLPPK